MTETVKEILNDYGYENWTGQHPDDDYKVSKERLDKTHKAIVQKRKDKFARDIAAYDDMVANKPDKPPRRK